jgi:hypothetical protein
MTEPMPDDTQLPEADLARLADGTLPAERHASVHAELAGSPGMAAALAEQERAVAMMRALDVGAPGSLRARIEALGTPRRARIAWRWRPAFAIPGATAIALAAAAVVVLVGGGSSAPPTVAATVRLTLAAATLPAPSADRTADGYLSLKTGGIRFPDWSRTDQWRASGARTDTLDGRRVVTVFYTAHGTRVGYAIVSGSPLTVPPARRTVWSAGSQYTLTSVRGARLVTWRQHGHTCVLAGRSVAFATLLKLATADGSAEA